MKKKKFIYTEDYAHPTFIMLNVTDACNLACRYCFVEQHPHYMTLDVAKQAIDWAYNNYCYQKEHKHKFTDQITVNFFGGEPMLMYDQIIVPTVLYAEEKYPNLFNFGITTNCTLLSKEKIDFFYEHKFGILTSIDGAEITQCYNRPCRNGANSSKMIEKNIHYLLEKFPDLIFRSTGYAPTIQYTFENFLYAESLGFKQYVLCLNERDKWSNIQIEILKEQLNKIFLYQLTHPDGIKFKYTGRINDYINLLIINKQNTIKDDLFRCGLGTRTCAIGWDGKIYGCQQDVSLDKKNIMYIGDLTNGIDKKKHIYLLKKYLNDYKKYPYNILSCHKCQLRKYCQEGSASGCPSTNLNLFNNSHQVSKIKCKFNKILFKEALLTKVINSSINDDKKEGV